MKMKVIRLSGAVVFVPYNKMQTLVLWLLSFFVGSYERTFNPDAYPAGRRLKIEFKK